MVERTGSDKGIRLGIMFGGRSGEHEISLISARSVASAAVAKGYEIVGIGITREGRWVYVPDALGFLSSGRTEVTPDCGPYCCLVPDGSRKGLLVEENSGFQRVPLDVVFPVLHGVYGEDGTIQGYLEICGIPYVGAPTLASAICMDKDVTKRILREAGIPCLPARVVRRYSWERSKNAVICSLLDSIHFPCFVKPSGSGSSLGAAMVKRPEDLPPALDKALLYDWKALIEPALTGALEVECSVLGNDEPEVSIPGQIVPAREFYDYEAKYVDPRTKLLIPAHIDETTASRVREIARRAFLATECQGMARVDFFVLPATGEVYVNELNTIPGFTSVSMYPKLWEASGLPYPDLVGKLVDLALERQKNSWKHVLPVAGEISCQVD
ncbi:MAG TPA: D-alanine--D-alanine ligase [Firmicutes bacterium]|nr:D-alanine--D-alanine ligase [Candidatus Fermentithermobacillaceae bacterium]